MPWPISVEYVLTRAELEAILEEACWTAWEAGVRSLSAPPGAYTAPTSVAAAVQEALDGLWRQAVLGPPEGEVAQP